MQEIIYQSHHGGFGFYIYPGLALPRFVSHKPEAGMHLSRLEPAPVCVLTNRKPAMHDLNSLSYSIKTKQ